MFYAFAFRTIEPTKQPRIAFLALAFVLMLAGMLAGPQNHLPTAYAAWQDTESSESPSADAFDRATRSGVGDNSPPGANPKPKGINFLELLVKGGWFMIPLAMLSVLVVTITIERLFVLSKSRIVPTELVVDVGRLSQRSGGFDPREAYQLCQKHPSPAGRVIQAMLQMAGRPMAEVEKTVTDTSNREADRLHGKVRWLSLTATIAPLIGLLGTVWGMIDAFYETTQLSPDQNKVETLANGIYLALVTTLAGLIIAFRQPCWLTTLKNEFDIYFI
jgi:biopolymer transport protein ExbB